jgi:hypothetical protein
MRLTYTEQVRNRLNGFMEELSSSVDRDGYYHDRLRAFRHYCDDTPLLAQSLAQLPETSHDSQRAVIHGEWPDGDEGYTIRWRVMGEFAEKGIHGLPGFLDVFLFSTGNSQQSLKQFTNQFVLPIYHYLLDQLETASNMLYLLWRYRRWAEWFQAERLRGVYDECGEKGLDRDLRCFLFESGIDYPYSQPRSLGGQADVIAGLETDDPLVLEIKVWNSSKQYKEKRIRDGLRQVIEYATKYGKDKGYVAVFNLDSAPLEFESSTCAGEWPARLEIGGRTYFFMAFDIGEQTEPISRRDKGKLVSVNRVRLDDLLDEDADSLS